MSEEAFACICDGGPRRTRGGRCVDCDGVADLGTAELFNDIGRCGGCHTTIGWVTNRFGKPLALDLEPNENGTVELHRHSSGITVVLELEQLDLDIAREEGRPLHIHHRETCPVAGRFRKGSRHRPGSMA